MTAQEIIIDMAEEHALEKLRKKSKAFDAVTRIHNCLVDAAEQRIAPDSKQGKHLKVEVDDAIEEFNAAYKSHGLKPNLSINYELCEEA